MMVWHADIVSGRCMSGYCCEAVVVEVGLGLWLTGLGVTATVLIFCGSLCANGLIDG